MSPLPSARVADSSPLPGEGSLGLESSIFQKALSQVGPYDAQLKELGKVDVETAVRELTTTDVRNATDIFREIAEATDFVDGRVSIEVDPRLAHDTENTAKQAVELWEKVNRPNAMIKIPPTAMT